jgi:hypothetical protein
MNKEFVINQGLDQRCPEESEFTFDIPNLQSNLSEVNNKFKSLLTNVAA